MELNKIFPSFAGSSFNINDYMDVLNLQSDNPSNYTVVSGGVSQWNDLSGNNNHAVQVTGSARPTNSSGVFTFDSGDSLVLTNEIQRSVFSLYFVIKNNTTGFKNALGGSSAHAYTDSSNTISVFNIGGANQWSLNAYGNEYYQVLSVRRNGASLVMKINGRTLQQNSASGTLTGNFNLGFIGRSSGGASWVGVIRGVCMDSQYVDDATDALITNALFSKYNLPEVSNAITGFGDSITVGTGSSGGGSWLTRLGIAKGRPIKRLGIGSTPLSNVGGFTNNGQDRYPIHLLERPYSDTICLLYGTNDIGLSYTTASYNTSLRAVIAGILAAGYSPSKFCVGHVPYQLANAQAAKIATMNGIIDSASSDHGLLSPALTYELMLAVGDSCMFDSLHPNNTGHQLIADAFAARIA